MKLINFEIVLEAKDRIDGFTICEIDTQSYNREDGKITISFRDSNNISHVLSSVDYEPHNDFAVEFTAECIVCKDVKKYTISNLDDLRTICKYRFRSVSNYDRYEAVMNEFVSTKDFFEIINAVDDKNPMSVCDICSYHRPIRSFDNHKAPILKRFTAAGDEIVNKNSKVVLIPPHIERILNFEVVSEKSEELYDEYEPTISKEDIPKIYEKLSTAYSYLSLEDVPDLAYVEGNGKSKYEKLNALAMVYTCGELKYIYHKLKNLINVDEDANIADLIESEQYDKLIPYEIALILLNEYDQKSKTYSKSKLAHAIETVIANPHYKNIDLGEIKDTIIGILSGVFDGIILQELLGDCTK